MVCFIYANHYGYATYRNRGRVKTQILMGLLIIPTEININGSTQPSDIWRRRARAFPDNAYGSLMMPSNPVERVMLSSVTFGSTTTPAWCAMLTYKPKKWGQIFDFDISIFINIICQIKRSDPFSSYIKLTFSEFLLTKSCNSNQSSS